MTLKARATILLLLVAISYLIVINRAQSNVIAKQKEVISVLKRMLG